MKLLIHVEQYDVVGILPSQLESIALLASAMGVSRVAYVDGTIDGFPKVGGMDRFDSLDDFFAAEPGPYVAFGPDKGEDVRSLEVPSDAWLMFGPSMGWFDKLDGQDVTWAKVPGGAMNSRDVVPIALWELSAWQVQ